MTTRRLLAATLPIALAGCSTFLPQAMDRLTSDAAPFAVPATVATAAEAQPQASVQPTVDRTLTGSAAPLAQISTDPALASHLPTSYGAMALRIHWPQRQGRSVQTIPSSANSVWIQVYSGSLGTVSGGPPPSSGTLLASRVVGPGPQQPPPSQTMPTSTQPFPLSPSDTTVYMALPPGKVTIWAGSYSQTPSQLATASNPVYLTSAQADEAVTADQITLASAIALGANPALQSNVAAISPSYAGPGASVTLTGTGFGTDSSVAAVDIIQPVPSGCNGCAAPAPIPLTITAFASTSITATVPSPLSVNGPATLQVTVNGIPSNQVPFNLLSSLSLVLDPNSYKQEWINSQYYNATAIGATVGIQQIQAQTQTYSQTPPNIAGQVVVAVTGPGGPVPLEATTSADPGGSFVASQAGNYTITATSGSVSSSMLLTAYQTTASLSSSSQAYTLALWPSGLSGWSVDQSTSLLTLGATFLDSSNNPYPPTGSGNPLGWGDFSLTSSDKAVIAPDLTNAGQVDAVGPGIATYSASLRMNPAVVVSKSFTVLAPTGISLSPTAVTLSSAGGSQYVSPAIAFTCPGTSVSETADVGEYSDFLYTSSNSSIVTAGLTTGLLTAVAAGTAEVYVNLKSGVTMPDGSTLTLPTATVSVTVN